MNQKEKIIIDLRKSNQHDLLVLSKLLVNLSAILSCQGLTIQISKSPQKTPYHAPQYAAKS